MLLVTSTHRTMLRTKLWENPSSITSCVTSRTWTRRQRIRRTDPHGAVVQDLAIPQLHRLNMILRSTMSFETSSSHIWRKLIPRSVLIKVRSLAFHGIDIYYRPAQQPHGYWQVCRHACAVFITMWPSCFEVKFKGDFQATNKILGKPHRPFLSQLQTQVCHLSFFQMWVQASTDLPINPQRYRQNAAASEVWKNSAFGSRSQKKHKVFPILWPRFGLGHASITSSKALLLLPERCKTCTVGWGLVRYTCGEPDECAALNRDTHRAVSWTCTECTGRKRKNLAKKLYKTPTFWPRNQT